MFVDHPSMKKGHQQAPGRSAGKPGNLRPKDSMEGYSKIAHGKHEKMSMEHCSKITGGKKLEPKPIKHYFGDAGSKHHK